MMKKISIGIGVMIAFVAMVSMMWWTKPKVTETEVKASIEENLPVGSSFEQIQTYLEESEIEHSWSEKENKFFAIVRNVQKGLLVRTDIAIEIHLDDEKKLKTVEVRKVHTGP